MTNPEYKHIDKSALISPNTYQKVCNPPAIFIPGLNIIFLFFMARTYQLDKLGGTSSQCVTSGHKAYGRLLFCNKFSYL